MTVMSDMMDKDINSGRPLWIQVISLVHVRILRARHSQKLSREAFERPSPHFAAATAQALAATVGSI